MDWLLARQGTIEEKLAKRHLTQGSLVLMDVTSSYFEGRTCPLAHLGHSRDSRPDRPQVVFALMTDARGCPVAVEVFEGNTSDPKTLSAQIEKLQQRFGLAKLVLIGDRGLLTSARIKQELRPARLDWITARQRGPLRGADRIGLRVGRVLGRFKMAKHFLLEITDEGFHYTRDHENIRAEAALDGIYVIRTSVSEEQLTAEAAVSAYKSLSVVERAFRTFKGVDLQVRPIHHRLGDRVRAHIFLCMLAYHLEWHLKQDLAPLLFQDEDPAAGAAQRASVVQPAQAAKRPLARCRGVTPRRASRPRASPPCCGISRRSR